MDSMSKTHATALIYELPFRFHTLHSRSRKVPRNREKVLHFVQAFTVFDQEILFHGTLFLTFPERQKEAWIRNKIFNRHQVLRVCLHSPLSIQIPNEHSPTYRQKSQITNHFHGNVYLLQLGHQHTEREKRASRMDNSKLLICHVFSSEIPEQTHIKTENSWIVGRYINCGLLSWATLFATQLSTFPLVRYSEHCAIETTFCAFH